MSSIVSFRQAYNHTMAMIHELGAVGYTDTTGTVLQINDECFKL
jgi:hypothetical protein